MSRIGKPIEIYTVWPIEIPSVPKPEPEKEPEKVPVPAKWRK